MSPHQVREVLIRRRGIGRRLQNLQALRHKGCPSNQVWPVQRHGRIQGQEEAGQPRPTALDAGRIGRRIAAERRRPAFRRVFSAEANVNGHDGGHVDELIELELLEMLRRPVPDDGHVHRLHQLQVLFARDNDLFGKELHQLLLQDSLDRVVLARGGCHDGQKQRRLRLAQLHHRRTMGEHNSRQVSHHVLLVLVEQPRGLFHRNDAAVDNIAFGRSREARPAH